MHKLQVARVDAEVPCGSGP